MAVVRNTVVWLTRLGIRDFCNTTYFINNLLGDALNFTELIIEDGMPTNDKYIKASYV